MDLRKWRRLTRLQKSLLIALLLACGIIFLGFSFQRVSRSRKFHRLDADAFQVFSDDVPRTVTKESISRRQAVVRAFRHSWKAYKLYAWGKDEVHPLSRSNSTWMGAALTMVDSLDTLWLMGLKTEYLEARSWIAANLKFDQELFVSVFEVVIRILGGLLSIYYLTNDSMYLEKAVDLGDRLLPAFKTDTALPLSKISLAQRLPSTRDATNMAITAEVGTISLEFLSLAEASGHRRFRKVVDDVTARLHAARKLDGLVPTTISTATGQFQLEGTYTVGATVDSYYEYLVKQWVLLKGKRSDAITKGLLQDYQQALAGMRKRLFLRSKPNNLLFPAELVSNATKISKKMDHLACFLPGTLAYGVLHGMPADHLDTAIELARTCYSMYSEMPTGLSPEIVYFNTAKGSKEDFIVQSTDRHNLQRPETIESLFYLYRVTHEKKYRDWGWRMFQAFERYTKVQPAGHVSIGDVTDTSNVRKRTKCESFWFAETLKYFFLLFSDDSTLDLRNHVINTEAHPLPIR